MSANVYSFIYFSRYACYLCDRPHFMPHVRPSSSLGVIFSLAPDYLGAGTSVMLGFGDYCS